MRDLVVIAICLAGTIAALKRPWIGIMLWTWLSIMNPHRYTYGMAYSAPLAAAAAAAVVIGLAMTKERESPFKGAPITFFAFFVAWITVSWLAGLDFSGDYPQWKKVMKIDGMILIALMLLHSKKHIISLMWVCVGSLALLGIKGGIFTLTSGGGYRVWGPPGSFIEDNNEFALALVMTIPLLRFLQMQLSKAWQRHAMTITMLLCAAAALGSQSRGALLAISAMAITLWWRGKRKFAMAVVLGIVGASLVAFMPDTWSDRMATIETYEEDRSAMGRISAWWTAWRIAQHYPFGVGLNAFRPELFAAYSPYPDMVHAAHSIYFQVLGHHGYVGLILFLAIWISTWRSANWLRGQKGLPYQAQWAADLGAMCQVSLVGYAIGGAFLSLAYFDLPYNIMVMVVLARVWVTNQKWKVEPVSATGHWSIPGLISPNKNQ
jgi:putative inorganic carbon (hco3(-)) transporter